MKNNLNVITTKYFNKNHRWQNINPIDLKMGMIFKMFEPDGSLITRIGDEKSSSIFKTFSDAYYNKDGIIGIQITD